MADLLLWGILAVLVALVLFLYLLARRALVDFKRGVREGSGKD